MLLLLLVLHVCALRRRAQSKVALSRQLTAAQYSSHSGTMLSLQLVQCRPQRRVLILQSFLSFSCVHQLLLQHCQGSIFGWWVTCWKCIRRDDTLQDLTSLWQLDCLCRGLHARADELS